ncbi:HdeD family acid-resistance protein [Cutibacterium sp. V947]|uniref:HdeD family acid-resistance protein n=1 Tax=unclassified Cutibacterium TaxID=2649671 RepID=UPI003EDEF5ED
MSSQTLTKTWKSMWWIPLTKGILAIIAAVVAVVWSHQTMEALVVIVGVYAIVDSIMTLINAHALHGMAGTGLMKAWGIIGIIVGLVLVIHPGFSLHVIAILIGVWLVLLGVAATGFALPMRFIAEKAWGWMLGGGVGLFVLGIIIVVHPGFGVVAMSWLLAIGVLLYGVANIAIAVGLRKVTSSIVSAVRRNPRNTVIEGEVVDSPNTSQEPSNHRELP